MVKQCENIIYLKQNHFVNGTVILHNEYYIATNPDTYKTEKIFIKQIPNTKLVYKLVENIVFNPNSNNIDMLIDQGIPKKEQLVSNGGYYHDMAYGIGFFAALVVSGNNYEIDMNKCILEQSYQHSIRQRFFALIETANAPFLPKSGPHDFIDIIQAASYVTIKNGVFGRSSHHGIHGNNNTNLNFIDLTFYDFEVAAIALNGGSYNTFENIHVMKNNHNIPVLGMWSAALFLYPYIDYLSIYNPNFILDISGKKKTSKQIYKIYKHTVEKVLKELSVRHYTNNPLFNNPKKIIDGPFYGILLNQTNVAVNGFPSKYQTETNKFNKMTNIIIEQLRGFNDEIPSLFNDSGVDTLNSYTNKNIQNDVVGAVFQTQNYYLDKNSNKIPLTVDDEGVYIGNFVSDTQLIIAKAIHSGFNFGRQLSIRVNSIQPTTIKWVECGYKLRDTELYYIFQGDSMHHVIKGGIAIRADCVSYSEFKNIKIKNIINETTNKMILYDNLIGISEKDIQPKFINVYNNYKNGISVSHSKATYPSNQASNIRGISLSNSFNNILMNIDIYFMRTFVGDIKYIDYHDSIRMIEKNTIEKNIQYRA